MNILIISHSFHPFKYVSAKRMSALAVFLKQKGDDVTVICADKKEYGNNVYDYELNDLNIYHVVQNYSNKICQKIFRPSQYAETLKKVLSIKHIDLIIISAGPFNYLSIVKKIKEINLSIKIVVDFRDILDGSDSNNNHKGFLKRIGYRMDLLAEKNAVKFADCIWVVSNSMKNYYSQRYKDFRYKFYNIQNGYDDILTSKSTLSVIEKFTDYKRNDRVKFYIGVFGKFGWYDESYNGMLREVIEKLLEDNIFVIIRQYGFMEERLKQTLFVNNASHYEYVESKGYEKDILELQKCDATIATSYLSEALGTKIFDYILINRPIIVYVPKKNSEMNRLVVNFENGYPCTNKRDVYNSIIELSRKDNLYLTSNHDLRSEYSRSNQFEKSYKLINDIVRG